LGVELVIRNTSGEGLMAFGYGDLVTYGGPPTLFVEVVEQRRFQAQFRWQGRGRGSDGRGIIG